MIRSLPLAVLTLRLHPGPGERNVNANVLCETGQLLVLSNSALQLITTMRLLHQASAAATDSPRSRLSRRASLLALLFHSATRTGRERYSSLRIRRQARRYQTR